MWLNPKPNVALECVSTNDQMIQSNVVPLYNIGYISLPKINSETINQYLIELDERISVSTPDSIS